MEGGGCKVGTRRPCGVSDTGLCKKGDQVCESDGSWGVCENAIFPTPEFCGDGKDNDCDGKADEAECTWVTIPTTPKAAKGLDIAVDLQENAYVVGEFTGSLKFGNIVECKNQGQADLFVVKVGPDGKYLWVRCYGKGGQERARAVAVDNKGFVYIAGDFSSQFSFGSIPLRSVGKADAFIVKMQASDAKVIWAKSGGGKEVDRCVGVAVHPGDGSVYCSGEIEGKASFGSVSLAHAGKKDGFVVKLDAKGKALWARTIGNSDIALTTCVRLDAQGNMYTVGYFLGTTSIFSQKTIKSPNNKRLGFILKTDAKGTLTWIRTLTANTVVGVDVDAQGKVLICGSFGSQMQAGSLIGKGGIAASGYIAQLDAQGTFEWLTTAKSQKANYCFNVKANAQNIYTTGFYIGQVSFGPISLKATNSSTNDIFISATDRRGRYQWAVTLGGRAGDVGLAVAASRKGAVYATGQFSSLSKFGPKIQHRTTDATLYILKFFP